MDRINSEELVEGKKYLAELEFVSDDGGKCLPLRFKNTKNIDDFSFFEKNVKIYSLPENDKVIIPKFVADKIEYCQKEGGYSLFHAMDHCFQFKDSADWLEDNQYTFTRAWFDGYEAEKEQLYIIKLNNGQVLVSKNGTMYFSENLDADAVKLTLKALKSTDFIWALPFAKPVEAEDND